jgi:hypothetical protein
MSTIPVLSASIHVEGYEDVPAEDMFPGAKCSICGKKPNAMWSGEVSVFVCAWCAESVLPALIADAVVGHQRAHRFGERARWDCAYRSMERAKHTFWRALAIAYARLPEEMLDDAALKERADKGSDKSRSS